MSTTLERLKELEAKATQRRWSYDGCSLSDFDDDCHMTAEWVSNGYEEDEDNGDRERKDADGELFAILRNRWPAVLKALEAAQAMRGAMRQTFYAPDECDYVIANGPVDGFDAALAELDGEVAK